MSAIAPQESKAGKELRAVLATEVMGWHPVWVRGYSVGHIIGGHYASEEECAAACNSEQRPIHLWADERGSTFGKGEDNWRPDEDIKAAWEVVTAVRGWIFSQRLMFKKALQAVISDRMLDDGTTIAADEILLWVTPADICHAALRSKSLTT